MAEINPKTGVCTLDLHIPASNSLKAKRHALKSIKDTIKNKFNVSLSEYDYEDLWQRSAIALAMVARHEEPIRQTFERIRSYIESRGDVLVVGSNLSFY